MTNNKMAGIIELQDYFPFKKTTKAKSGIVLVVINVMVTRRSSVILCACKMSAMVS